MLSVHKLVETDANLNIVMEKLKADQDLGNHVSSDMVSHLSEMLSRILQYHHYDAFEKFEEISLIVKSNNFNVKNASKDDQLSKNIDNRSVVTNRQAITAIMRAKELMAGQIRAATPDKALISTAKTAIPNLVKDAAMLKWAGVDFGSAQVNLLQRSLNKLASTSGATQLKLFGKIFGTQSDYWVAQGTLPFAEEKPVEGNEIRGEGVNTLVYWVTDNLLTDWIQLPEASPDQMVAAKMIKYAFTGDLNASIDSCPPFPGKERHLLRAQVARIAHATELCPLDTFVAPEEDG